MGSRINRYGFLLLVFLLGTGVLLTAHSIRRAVGFGDWSDASRQWEVCQYVKARINPYELAFRLLHETFGPATGANRIRLKETRIYSISSAQWDESTPGLLPGHPPPEATYPPSTVSMLLPTIGLLPKPALLDSLTAVNLVFLAFWIVLAAGWLRQESGLPRPAALLMTAALILLWPPLQLAIQHGQVGILVLLCAAAATAIHARQPVAAGVLYTVAMIKPSLVLLFLIIPLVKGNWKTILTTAFLGILLTLLPAVWLREWPWVLLAQWMGLCQYVLQGAFTLQEVLNAVSWENTLPGTLVVLALWSAVLGWCLWWRHARAADLFAFLCLANLAWTYHERPDFTLLAFLLVRFGAWLPDPVRRKTALAGLGLCLVLGLALSDAFYIPSTAWAHALRWAGRAALPGLWILTAAAVRNSHREQLIARPECLR